MAALIEGLQAVTLHVTDIPRAREFYANVLGLEEETPQPHVPRAVFKIPGTSTKLLIHVQGGTEGGREPGTVSGIFFHCPDPLAACVQIQRHGGRIVGEPWTMKRGESKVVRAVIADPDGNEMILSSEL
ncbi:MAG: VOC family protein [Thermoplasmata archaeon]|nr:VOC family protein [Thermoplasmata archaeon]MCI4356129.1 VOC family protein [Thermoplasmata archaeon]